MSIKSDIQAVLLSERKRNSDSIASNILRLVLGEIDTAEANPKRNSELNDQEIIKIMKKLISSNIETISHCKPEKDSVLILKLENENYILELFIPKSLTYKEIYFMLEQFKANVRQMNAGQAIGFCVKYLKSMNLEYNIEDVKKFLKDIEEED